MTEPRQEIRRVARIFEVIFAIVAVPLALGFLYVVARFVRWAVDPNYHLFSK
jgi:hypothetical protein